VHLLRYVVKCTVTDSLLNTQTSCLKCPPSVWITFLTRVTRELVTLQSTSVLHKVTSSLVTQVIVIIIIIIIIIIITIIIIIIEFLGSQL